LNVKLVTMPKLPPPPRSPPEELGVLLFAGHDELAVGGDDIARAEAVDGQPELAHQMTEPPAQGQAANSGVADDPAGCGEPGGLALSVQMREQAAALDLDVRQWIDP
jgi:hypothetical protein